MTITFQEKRLLDLYRAADERARADVLWILEEHPEKNGEPETQAPKIPKKQKGGLLLW